MLLKDMIIHEDGHTNIECNNALYAHKKFGIIPKPKTAFAKLVIYLTKSACKTRQFPSNILQTSSVVLYAKLVCF